MASSSSDDDLSTKELLADLITSVNSVSEAVSYGDNQPVFEEIVGSITRVAEAVEGLTELFTSFINEKKTNKKNKRKQHEETEDDYNEKIMALEAEYKSKIKAVKDKHKNKKNLVPCDSSDHLIATGQCDYSHPFALCSSCNKTTCLEHCWENGNNHNICHFCMQGDDKHKKKKVNSSSHTSSSSSSQLNKFLRLDDEDDDDKPLSTRRVKKTKTDKEEDDDEKKKIPEYILVGCECEGDWHPGPCKSSWKSIQTGLKCKCNGSIAEHGNCCKDEDDDDEEEEKEKPKSPSKEHKKKKWRSFRSVRN